MAGAKIMNKRGDAAQNTQHWLLQTFKSDVSGQTTKQTNLGQIYCRSFFIC